jgi:AcrR family transcriptional regulator
LSSDRLDETNEPAGGRLLPISGAPPPERADAARNRARILNAARQLLAERDPCDVSIDAIAEAAGVGKGTVYRRFGDRGGLMQALLDDHEQSLQAAVLTGPPPLGPGAEPADRLVAFLCTLVDQWEEFGDLIAEAEAGMGERPSAPYHFRWMHLRVLLDEARPDLDTEVLASVLLAPLSRSTYRRQRRVADERPERIKAALTALVTALSSRG